MPKVRANGIDIYYEVHGEGEPLVMIMGLGGDSRAWMPVLPPLSERYRVIVFDNRGVGQTDKPESPYSIPLLASDTLALLDALGIERAHILGGSFGGLIAQEIAISHPERVRSLILSSTSAKVDRLQRAVFLSQRTVAVKLGMEHLSDFVFPWGFSADFFENHSAELEMARAMMVENSPPLHAYLNQLDAALNHDATDRLSQITAPTLVTVGCEDILTPLHKAKVLSDGIPGAKLVVLSKGGHSSIVETPEELVASVFEFLGSL